MAVVPSNHCFKLVHVKFLLILKNVITIKLFLRSLTWKLLVEFKATKFSQFGRFLFYCPFKGGYSSSLSLSTSKCVSASTYEKCPLMEG